jgi:hypothetical protein
VKRIDFEVQLKWESLSAAPTAKISVRRNCRLGCFR